METQPRLFTCVPARPTAQQSASALPRAPLREPPSEECPHPQCHLLPPILERARSWSTPDVLARAPCRDHQRHCVVRLDNFSGPHRPWLIRHICCSCSLVLHDASGTHSSLLSPCLATPVSRVAFRLLPKLNRGLACPLFLKDLWTSEPQI